MDYPPGTKAWQQDDKEGWVASEVTSKQVDGDKVTLVFALENGEVCILREPPVMNTGVGLTCLLVTDQNPRDHRRRPVRREQCAQRELDSPTFDEPCYARSER